MHPNPRLPGSTAGGGAGGRSRGSHGVLARVLPALLVAAVTCGYIWFVTVSLPSAREGGGGGGSDVDDDVRGLLRRHRRGGGGGDDSNEDARELKTYHFKKTATSKKAQRNEEKNEENEEGEDQEKGSRKGRRGDDKSRKQRLRQQQLRRRNEGDDDSAESADDAASSRGGGEAEAMDSSSSSSSSSSEDDDDDADSADNDDSDSEAGGAKHRNDKNKHSNTNENKGNKNSRHHGSGGYGVDAVADEAALDRLFALYADDDPEDAPSSEDAFYTRGRYRADWGGSRRAGRIVELFKRYAAFHKKALGGGGSGAYETVVVSPVGQLCNRLMTITSGFVLALLTRKVLVVQDTGFYCSMNDLFEEPGFAWLGGGGGGGGGSGGGGPPHVVSNPPHPPWSDMEPLLCGDLRTAYPGSVLLRMNQYIVPYMTWNPHHRGALRALFGGGRQRKRGGSGRGDNEDALTDVFTPVSRFLYRPVGMLRKARDEFAKKHFKGRRVVGMQVRGGNDFTQNGMSKADWRLYEKCGEEEEEESSGGGGGEDASDEDHSDSDGGGGSSSGSDEDVVYFVATDTEEGRVAAKKHLKGGKVVFGPGPFLRSNNAKGVRMALLDVLLLAEADTLVTTAWSSFGYMAAGLRGRGKVVVSDHVEGGDVPVPRGTEQFFMGVPHKSDRRAVCGRPPSHQPCFHKFANWGAREATCFKKEMVREEMLNGRYC